MKETDFTRKLMAMIRKHQALQGAAIFKHNDFYTAGVPDFSITVMGSTTWFEIKVGKNKPTALQQHYLDRMHPRAWVIYGQTISSAVMSGVYYKSLEELVDRIVYCCINI